MGKKKNQTIKVTMPNGKADPMDAALKRLQSILEQACWQAKAFRLETVLALPSNERSAMIAKEIVIRDAISESCRAWIQSGSLPPMDDRLARYFFDRLRFGDKLLLWLRSGGWKCPPFSTNELLEWILIDSWPPISFELWKSELIDEP